MRLVAYGVGPNQWRWFPVPELQCAMLAMFSTSANNFAFPDKKVKYEAVNEAVKGKSEVKSGYILKRQSTANVRL